MILKIADSKKESIATLNELLSASQSDKQKALIQKDLRLLASGVESERQNAYYINLYLEKSKNILVLHDIRIEHDGHSAQIDHMLVSRFGIELIESKGFKGVLTINEDGSLDVDYKGQIKSFPNPLEQSKRHAEVLSSFVKDKMNFGKRVDLLGGLEIQSTVIIDPSTTITNKHLPEHFHRADSYITKRSEAIDKIGVINAFKLVSKMIDIKTSEELAQLFIDSHSPVRFDYRKKYKIAEPKQQAHEELEKTEAQRGQSKQLLPNDPCPFCNGKLILRNGKSDIPFLGCTNFPKCKFNRRISKWLAQELNRN